VSISREDRGNGHIKLLFNRTVYSGPFPRVYSAEQVTQFNLDDPCYPEEMSDTGRALVDHLIYHGHTGVMEVTFVSHRVVMVDHDTVEYPTPELEDDTRTLVRYVDRFGYADTK
jgi:hypothetical protein